MNEKNRVIELKRKQLGEVQDLTAEILQMERGSTLEERGGKRGRKHIPHREFRDIANQNRLGLDKEKDNANFYGSLVDEKNAQTKILRQKLKNLKQELLEKDAGIATLKAEYAAERAALKASAQR
jgi:hypothetical protein